MEAWQPCSTRQSSVTVGFQAPAQAAAAVNSIRQSVHRKRREHSCLWLFEFSKSAQPVRSYVGKRNICAAHRQPDTHTHHRRVANERLNPAGRTHNPQQALQALASQPARLPASQQDCQQATKIAGKPARLQAEPAKSLQSASKQPTSAPAACSAVAESATHHHPIGKTSIIGSNLCAVNRVVRKYRSVHCGRAKIWTLTKVRKERLPFLLSFPHL